MIRVISTEEEFKGLCEEVAKKKCTAIPIFSDPKKHLAVNILSLLIIFINDEIIVVPFNHNDAVSLSPSLLNQLIPFHMSVPFKKDMMYVLKQGNIIDISTEKYDGNNSIAECSTFYPKIILDMQLKYQQYKNANKCIPLMKWVEFAEAYYSQLNDTYSQSKYLMNDISIPIYYFIEQSGLKVDSNILIEHFGEKVKKFIHDGFVYSNYWPYTTTGRPTNTFGINFSALNKSDGSRKSFVSRFENGTLILIDFESFHLRLIADLIDFPQPTEPFHEYLGKEYFKVAELTAEQYDEGKQRTFSYLYGDDRHGSPIAFFDAVYRWREAFWIDAQLKGYFVTKSGRKMFLSNIECPTKSKTFNYLLQATESEESAKLLYNLIPLYKNAQSKLILYTYDSILIDFCQDDGVTLLQQTKSTLEHGGHYPVRMYSGQNYHEMDKKLTF